MNLAPEAPTDTHIGATILFSSSSSSCTFASKIGPAQKNRKLLRYPYPEVIVQRKPSLHEEPTNTGKRVKTPGQVEGQEVVEVVGVSLEKVEAAIAELCGSSFAMRRVGAQENIEEPVGILDKDVVKIVDSGPPSNRIDVVFMGDGYTLDERDKFFADMKRLTDDMFTGPTFVSTRPLFNIWAVFQPSAESGIGVGGNPKNTSFGLYRSGTELRGIYCSKPDEARRACLRTGQLACDFPSLIGNSDYYGGLGGEFTIATRSETSGTVVLRHELGHNFIQVGEEYDGGSVYSGCNAADSLDQVGWKHWLTEPENLREEKSALVVQDYSWYDLAEGPYKIPFNSTGEYKRWGMVITSSGTESPGSLEVYLDGRRLEWTTSGILDRSFYNWEEDTALTPGLHVLEFRSGFPPANSSSPIRQLCSVTMHEYQAEPEYHFDNSFISTYPTIDFAGTKTYRPTNAGCLMRNMTTPHFCSVCKEGMFLQLLQKVSVIDNVDTFCISERKVHTAKVNVIPVAQFRPEGERIEGEKFEVTWYKDGVVQEGLKDMLEVDVEGVEGMWEVEVKFVTPEIRYDPDNLTLARVEVKWSDC
ncbi:hypothetical protein HDV05_008577 [Chytridiales sp. JEL 0842]|nr:hypothetical protein HDV05_008577 [Chytridiales sp. JEL 0842]